MPSDPSTQPVLDSALDWVADHTRRYVESGGEDGHEWRGVSCLVLTTVGRRSGAMRRNALIYALDGDDYVLVASYGGAPSHPLWYENLVVQPKVEMQVGADIVPGVARTVSGDERGRLWEMMAAVWPAYDEYQAKADLVGREIPVVVVSPT